MKPLKSEIVRKSASQRVVKLLNQESRLIGKLKRKPLEQWPEKEIYFTLPEAFEKMLAESEMSVFLETAIAYGNIVGEKIFKAFLDGQLKQEKIHQLFRMNLSDKEKLPHQYLFLLNAIKAVRLDQTSKTELL